ncbi:MAG: hypothetical protein ABI629_22820 [bacterium]
MLLVLASLWSSSPALVAFATAPGLQLWHFSNWLCPPFGERCFLRSEKILAHHLWGALCYTTAWWAIFSGLAVGFQWKKPGRKPNLAN